MIATLGVQGAAVEIAADSDELEAVSAGVASGRREWLDVGIQLVGTAQDYLEERLVQAFSEALVHNAAGVLERGANGVPLDLVCGYDPLSPISDVRTRGQFYDALAPRERAVAAVRRGDLDLARRTCQTALARLRATGATRYLP